MNNVSLCPDQFNALCTGNALNPANFVRFGINALLFVAFIASLGFLIFGGIRWIISGGDKENTAKAKGTVTAALIGLAIVLSAWVLLNLIATVFKIGPLNVLNIPTL